MLELFLSSRRRHTRWPRDWSSDVCSSDLNYCRGCFQESGRTGRTGNGRWFGTETGPPFLQWSGIEWEIGRASCRERVWNQADAGSVIDNVISSASDRSVADEQEQVRGHLR